MPHRAHLTSVLNGAGERYPYTGINFGVHNSGGLKGAFLDKSGRSGIEAVTCRAAFGLQPVD